MKMNSNRNRLIVEFKRAQRLPDWPIIKVTNLDRSSEKSSERKVSMPPAGPRAAFPAQGFAE
jgi:hypothetical protein